MSEENKNLSFDRLRALATIAVIGIHVSSDYVPAQGSIAQGAFWWGNLYDSLSRFAVPLFVMLSGALLLDREEPLGSFLRKRFARLLAPFFFWSCIYIVYDLYNEAADGVRHNAMQTVRFAFVQLRDGASLHLWYVYMIIGLYLFIPILGAWVRRATEKQLLFFLGIWVVCMLCDVPWLEKIKPDLDIRYFTGFAGYAVLGHYLKVKSFGSDQRTLAIGVGCILTGIAATVGGTYAVHCYQGNYVSTFYEPLSVNIMLYASGLFLLFRSGQVSCAALSPIRAFISRYSYGIYLCHVLWLRQLDDFQLRWDFIHPAVGTPVTVLTCLCLSGLTVYLVSKLPFGKYVAG